MVGDEGTIGIDYSSDVTHAPLVIAMVIEVCIVGRNAQCWAQPHDSDPHVDIRPGREWDVGCNS